MARFKKALRKAFAPGKPLAALLTVLAAAMLFGVFAAGSVHSVVAYIAYPLSAYSLAVWVIRLARALRLCAGRLAMRNPYARRYVSDREFRARVSLYWGFGISIIFALYYLISGLKYASVWFAAVAIFFLLLAIIRFSLLRNARRTGGRREQLCAYRRCGRLMLLLNVALSGMVIQMVWKNRGYQYPGLFIYFSAARAFCGVFITIRNVFRFRGLKAPLYSAAQMLSFAGALASLLAMQTALISRFGEDEAFRRIMNGFTGGAVCLIVFVMAIRMIVRANRELKKPSGEET